MKSVRKKVTPRVPVIDVRRTLLSMVNGSVGSTAFRQLFIKQKNRSVDILRNGELACAFFVSSILFGLRLLREPHATVAGTLRDMRASGWKRIRAARSGAVVLWKSIRYDDGETHAHLGFVVSRTQAVSTSFVSRRVAKHHLTYGRPGQKTYRQIESIWWHPKLK